MQRPSLPTTAADSPFVVFFDAMQALVESSKFGRRSPRFQEALIDAERGYDNAAKMRAAQKSYTKKPKPVKQRRCHNCGKPTPNFRCDECWEMIRGVMEE